MDGFSHLLSPSHSRYLGQPYLIYSPSLSWPLGIGGGNIPNAKENSMASKVQTALSAALGYIENLGTSSDMTKAEYAEFLELLIPDIEVRREAAEDELDEDDDEDEDDDDDDEEDKDEEDDE